MARKYSRDSRGRFSGGGGGGSRPKATGGSLGARSSARRSAAKLAGKDAADTSLSGTLSRRAQKAAVTRTGKASKAAQVANSTKLARKVTPSGTMRRSDVDFARKTNTHVKRVEGPKGPERERFVREKLAGVRMAEQKRLNDRAGASAARGGKVAGPAAQVAKPDSKLGFNQSDFLRRSQRTASIANPQVRQRAQQLYGKILNLDSSPKQLKTMFRKAGKPKRQASPRQSASRREHEDMLKLSSRLFR